MPGGDAAGDIHLGHEPAAENVAAGVGVLGHGHGARGQLAPGFLECRI